MALAPCFQAELGDAWQIFLLEDKEEKPTAVVLPSSAREGEISRFTEVRRGGHCQAAALPRSQQGA
jgi:hypothetical protein